MKPRAPQESTLLLNAAALLLLLAATVALAFALFFMNLRYGSATARLFAAGGVSWLAIMLSLTLADYFTRT